MRWKDHFPISSFSLADLGGGNDRGAYIAALLVMSSSLMVTNTAAGSHSLGRRSDLKVTIAMENAPGDAGDFIGERNR